MVQYHRSSNSYLLDQLFVVCPIRRRPGSPVHSTLSAELITTGIVMVTDNTVILGSGAFYGILFAIHLTQAIVCSAGTRVLARMTVLVLIVISTWQFASSSSSPNDFYSGHDNFLYNIALSSFKGHGLS